MRVGDFGLEVLGTDGDVRESDSGHVLARPNQVYSLRLRNYGPLRCVVEVAIDGRAVTSDGLVLEPYSKTDLERPVGDSGCFTVIPEGHESVFGPDGGRDNPALGLISARFRRELPGGAHGRGLEWTYGVPAPKPMFVASPPTQTRPRIVSLRTPELPRILERVDPLGAPQAFERAAGTGLTGRSHQDFDHIAVGPLEAEATVLTLRLVIASADAIAGDSSAAPLAALEPERPAARP